MPLKQSSKSWSQSSRTTTQLSVRVPSKGCAEVQDLTPSRASKGSTNSCIAAPSGPHSIAPAARLRLPHEGLWGRVADRRDIHHSANCAMLPSFVTGPENLPHCGAHVSLSEGSSLRSEAATAREHAPCFDRGCLPLLSQWPDFEQHALKEREQHNLRTQAIQLLST